MPKKIKNKKSDTHFEGDSVVGVRKRRHQTFITLVNTASQFLFIIRSQNKTADATVQVMNKLEEEIPELPKIMKTILFDNGVEFSKFEEMMKSNNGKDKRFQIYFAHPYVSYEEDVMKIKID